jgi:hypothetical protein
VHSAALGGYRGKSEAAHILAQAGGASRAGGEGYRGIHPPRSSPPRRATSPLGFFLANLQSRLGKRSFWDEKAWRSCASRSS